MLESGAVMDAKQEVLGRYPNAYFGRWGSCVQVARERTGNDKPSQIGFVSLSRLHYSESEAWEAAAK